MATEAKTIVLVTGGNGGIGLEIVTQLLAKGSYHVLLGSRSSEKGNAAVKDLQSQNLAGSVEMLLLDVTNDDTIERAAAQVEQNHGKLDILVNNAGIAATTPPLRDQMRQAFDTNAIGPAVVTKAFGPLLQKSNTSPRIINLSCGVGSIALRLDPNRPGYQLQEVQYRASKAALHMVTACQWVEYGPDIKVFAFDPGFTISNIGPHHVAKYGAKPASEAVTPLIEILEGKRDDEAGTFLHKAGSFPW